MSLSIKAGVRVFGLRPEILLAVIITQGVYDQFGAELVLTAGIDGAHTEGSFHYSGCAVDFRTNNLKPGEPETVLKLLQARLGPDYFVQLEGDHIHCQFKPKASYAGGVTS